METATGRQDLTEVFSSRHCLLELGVYQKTPIFKAREADDHLCIFSFVVHARSSMNADSCDRKTINSNMTFCASVAMVRASMKDLKNEIEVEFEWLS